MRRERSIFFVCLLAVVLIFIATGGHAQTPETLSLQDRALIASRIYRIVSTFFPGLPQAQFDSAYADYLTRVLKVENRREFDLLSMEFIADLHDGHSWFYDNWLDKTYGQPTGFVAYPLEGEWTIIRS